MGSQGKVSKVESSRMIDGHYYRFTRGKRKRKHVNPSLASRVRVNHVCRRGVEEQLFTLYLDSYGWSVSRQIGLYGFHSALFA